LPPVTHRVTDRPGSLMVDVVRYSAGGFHIATSRLGPTINLSCRVGKCFAFFRRMLVVPSNGTKGLPPRTDIVSVVGHVRKVPSGRRATNILEIHSRTVSRF